MRPPVDRTPEIVGLSYGVHATNRPVAADEDAAREGDRFGQETGELECLEHAPRMERQRASDEIAQTQYGHQNRKRQDHRDALSEVKAADRPAARSQPKAEKQLNKQPQRRVRGGQRPYTE